MMEELTAVGVRFAIDDFGVEHSALSHLAHLPLDTIKIDIAFISRMTADPRFASLVQAIVSIAKIMNKRTIAEGIETAEQHIFLRAYGCDAVQGHLFSKALPPREFAAFVAGL
jgi:EAL domain-containing protein (putative c-di-GMP-specific phosphodiesterase class I)